jgi:hypothetical protein
MRSFRASAPLKDLQRESGFTLERVVEAAKAQFGKGEISATLSGAERHRRRLSKMAQVEG